MYQIIWIRPNPVSIADWEPILESMVDEEEVLHWYNFLTDKYPDHEFQVITVH